MKSGYLSATILCGGLALAAISGAAWAQSTPKADDLVRSLTPTTTNGTTRGIHVVTPSNPAVPATTTTTGKPAPAPAATADAAPSASLSVLFATGSAELTPSAVKTLDVLGKALTDPRLAGSKFRIEGHTDTVGTPDSNKALSDARAKAVAAYLAKTFHIDPSKLDAIGMGEDGLLVKTGQGVPEARNRRVVVVNLGS
jgi:outer membrane protein OmpA-like peptidoglycan-associated protein